MILLFGISLLTRGTVGVLWICGCCSWEGRVLTRSDDVPSNNELAGGCSLIIAVESEGMVEEFSCIVSRLSELAPIVLGWELKGNDGLCMLCKVGVATEALGRVRVTLESNGEKMLAIAVCVCVCVCVWEREREIATHKYNISYKSLAVHW